MHFHPEEKQITSLSRALYPEVFVFLYLIAPFLVYLFIAHIRLKRILLSETLSPKVTFHRLDLINEADLRMKGRKQRSSLSNLEPK